MNLTMLFVTIMGNDSLAIGREGVIDISFINFICNLVKFS